jgi:hypothetical protein
MKTDARVTEWELSGLSAPQLIMEPKTATGYWTMKPSQHKALQTVDADGAPLPRGTPLTKANVEQIYGIGHNPDEMAVVAATRDAPVAPAAAADLRIRTNAELGLVDRQSFLKRGIMPSIECLHANIRARDPACELKRSYKEAGATLYDLIQRGVEPAQLATADPILRGHPIPIHSDSTTPFPMGALVQDNVRAPYRLMIVRAHSHADSCWRVQSASAPTRRRNTRRRNQVTSPTIEQSPTTRGQPPRNRRKTYRDAVVGGSN